MQQLIALVDANDMNNAIVAHKDLRVLIKVLQKDVSKSLPSLIFFAIFIQTSFCKNKCKEISKSVVKTDLI